jgi:hypothetical protein
MQIELTEQQKTAVGRTVKWYHTPDEKRKETFSIIGYAGTGKAQPVDTIIPTPHGNRRLSDLRVGDFVFDRLGTPTQITGVFPQGVLRCYEVEFSDGRKTKCNEEHLWTYVHQRGNFITRPLKDMIGDYKKRGSGDRENRWSYKYKIPTNHPIKYSKKQLPMDPYVLGCMIGDGCLRQKYLTISSSEEDIVSKVADKLELSYKKNSEFNYSWTFRDSIDRPVKTPEYIIPELVNKYSYEKYIPEVYLFSSEEDRVELLCGLLDTDGHVDIKGRIRYSTSSESLKNNILNLCFSLGMLASCRIDDRPGARRCYEIKIITNRTDIVTSKKHVSKLRQYKDGNKSRKLCRTSTIRNITETEPCEMLCISVDNKEQLYLTNDYIVTHNTTVVNYIVEELGIGAENIAFMTFTGKAALVLRRKGVECNTIHSTIYTRDLVKNELGDTVMKFVLLPSIDKKLFVIDEVSMVSDEMFRDVLSFGIPTIILGDDAQLPPVGGFNNYMKNPDVKLTEIHRQGKDDPIIRLSMKIRNGEQITRADGADNVGIITSRVIRPEYLVKGDIIIVGTHKLRKSINSIVRDHLGFDNPYFDEGEKVIFKMNNRNSMIFYDDIMIPICNGMIGFTKSAYNPDYDFDQWCYNDFLNTNQNIRGTKVSIRPEFCPDNKYYEDLRICSATIQTDNEKPFVGSPKDNINFLNYGYAITGHLSQGGEWDTVIVYDDWKWDEEMHRKYLYTAITRARKKLVLRIN